MEEEIKIQDLIEHIRFGTELKYDIKAYIIAIENLLDSYKKLKENYKRLSIEAQAIAFDEDNHDTETLMRVLLKQNQIKLENGEYKRQDFNWEENLYELGLMKKREKMFYIPDEECLDEYTKQLESQLKEYEELKKIFRKHSIKNETMYDGFCRLEEEIEEFKNQIKEILGIEENISNERLLDYIDLLVSENNRLEDIEDKKVQIEYQNVFNKGVKSIQEKIKEKIKTLEKLQKEFKDNEELRIKIIAYKELLERNEKTND